MTKAVKVKRDAVLNLRVPAEIKKALQRAALKDDRTVSGMAVRLLREALVARGHLEKE
jgi:hypothetical protein